MSKSFDVHAHSYTASLLASLTVMICNVILREQSERLRQLRELNPERADAYEREQALRNKSRDMACSKNLGGSSRLATRRGFDVGLASLDNYRGRDPIRAFGSTQAEHTMMVCVVGRVYLLT